LKLVKKELVKKEW